MENFPTQEGKVYKIFNIFVISMLILNLSMISVFFVDSGSAISAETGSISGCKYEDANKNGVIDSDEQTLSGWFITLKHGNDLLEIQETDNDGCYIFSELAPGYYRVCEDEDKNLDKKPYIQTDPDIYNICYAISLGDGSHRIDVDFGNYFPVCGNDILDTGFDGYEDEECDGEDNCDDDCKFKKCLISGHKFSDENNNSIWDNNEIGLNDWTIELYKDSISTKNLVTTTTKATIADLGYYEFNDLDAGTYFVQEQQKGDWIQTYPSDGFYTFILDWGEATTTIDFGNYFPECGNGIKDTGYIGYNDEECDQDDGTSEHYICTQECVLEYVPYCGDENIDDNEDCDNGENNGNECNADYGENCSYCSNSCEIINVEGAYCGDDEINGDEQCDDGNAENNDGCSSICQTEEESGNGDEENNGNTGGNSSGGGGGSISALYIHSENTLETGADNAIITWHTNKPATSRVVYGLSPVNPLGSWPNLGYENSTIENSEKTTFHEVTISGLLSNTLYYFRTISSASPEIFGEELSFTTTQEEQNSEQEESSEEESQENSADNEEETSEEDQTTDNENSYSAPAGATEDKSADKQENSEENSNIDSNQNENSNNETEEEAGQVLGESAIKQALLDNQEDKKETQEEIKEDEQEKNQENNQSQNFSADSNNQENTENNNSDTSTNENGVKSGWLWFIILIIIIAGGYAGYKAYYSKNKEQ